MVSVTSHKSFMAGMPVYIRITATATGNYTIKILITVDEEAEPVELYMGELYLVAGIEIAVDVADFLTSITKRTPLTIQVNHIDEDIQEYGFSDELYIYPGACESDEVAQAKITLSKSESQNWLLTTRSISSEIFIPETELTDDLFSVRHILNTLEPTELIRIKDVAGETIHTIADNSPILLAELRKTLFTTQNKLHNVFHFCYQYYNAIARTVRTKNDFTVYITQAEVTSELYFIDFTNQFGIKERIQLVALSYTPAFEKRGEYMRYNPAKAKLMPKYERVLRSDTLTGFVGICYGDRLSFVMDMLQSAEHTLVTPTGEYVVKVTPENNTLVDSQRKEYPISLRLEFSDKSEFAIFHKKNYNTRIFTSPFGAQFQ